MTRMMTLKLPQLHPGQNEARKSRARFKVLACGRRWGKSRLATALCLRAGLRNQRAWWVAPTFPMASIGWRMLKQLAQPIPGIIIREGERRITFPGGGIVQAKSADHPDSLRGEGLDFVALDECAFIKQEAWAEALRPALADREGGAIFISTPSGRNWFWRLYENAVASDNGWKAWRHPTWDNPFIKAEEIEAARSHLPERIFLQEFGAEFIEDAASVFRRVHDAAIVTKANAPIEGHVYAFGVDWGKFEDFTAIAVIDTTDKALVYLDRFNRIDYAVQSTRLKALADRFKPIQIIAERNSMGEPIIEQLRRMGLPVRPFLTTNASKADAIEALALAFERGDIQIINDPVLIGELQAYAADRLPSGLLRYNAPSRMHDDCVMALALAWQSVARRSMVFG